MDADRRRRARALTLRLILLVAGLAALPPVIEQVERTIASNPVNTVAEALGVPSRALPQPPEPPASPTLIVGGNRSLTQQQREALLRQAIAQAPLPLEAKDEQQEAATSPTDAAALRRRLERALIRVQQGEPPR
ncbi:MAG: hypothetical protein D6824_02475 [Planctomycetota bacterium]|nr:MAG: hypothetical protein D6824_02475 [Planctomycetota bacterium]